MTPYLANDEARCRPGCVDRRDTCGRFLAPLPTRGACIVDGAQQQLQWVACPLYIAASQCVPPVVDTRRVHPGF